LIGCVGGCPEYASIVANEGGIVKGRFEFLGIFRFFGDGFGNWRSGTIRAANGVAALPIVVVGRIDIAGAVEVEVVGVAAVRVRRRRPVVAVVAGAVEQVAGILVDVAAPNEPH